jgi:hypothetical protein
MDVSAVGGNFGAVRGSCCSIGRYVERGPIAASGETSTGRISRQVVGGICEIRRTGLQEIVVPAGASGRTSFGNPPANTAAVTIASIAPAGLNVAGGVLASAEFGAVGAFGDLISLFLGALGSAAPDAPETGGANIAGTRGNSGAHAVDPNSIAPAMIQAAIQAPGLRAMPGSTAQDAVPGAGPGAGAASHSGARLCLGSNACGAAIQSRGATPVRTDHPAPAGNSESPNSRRSKDRGEVALAGLRPAALMTETIVADSASLPNRLLAPDSTGPLRNRPANPASPPSEAMPAEGTAAAQMQRQTPDSNPAILVFPDKLNWPVSPLAGSERSGKGAALIDRSLRHAREEQENGADDQPDNAPDASGQGSTEQTSQTLASSAFFPESYPGGFRLPALMEPAVRQTWAPGSTPLTAPGGTEARSPRPDHRTRSLTAPNQRVLPGMQPLALGLRLTRVELPAPEAASEVHVDSHFAPGKTAQSPDNPPRDLRSEAAADAGRAKAFTAPDIVREHSSVRAEINSADTLDTVKPGAPLASPASHAGRKANPPAGDRNAGTAPRDGVPRYQFVVAGNTAQSAKAAAEAGPMAAHALEPVPQAAPDTANAEPAASAPERTHEPLPRPDPLQSTAQQIAVRFERADDAPVDLRVSGRGNQVRVTVRTADAALQSSLRQDLGTLVRSLDHAGYRTETLIPAERIRTPELPWTSPRGTDTSSAFAQRDWHGDSQRRGQSQQQSRNRNRRAAAGNSEPLENVA